MKDPKTTLIAVANFVILLVLIIGYIMGKISFDEIKDALSISGGLSVIVLGYFSRDSKKEEE